MYTLDFKFIDGTTITRESPKAIGITSLALQGGGVHAIIANLVFAREHTGEDAKSSVPLRVFLSDGTEATYDALSVRELGQGRIILIAHSLDGKVVNSYYNISVINAWEFL